MFPDKLWGHFKEIRFILSWTMQAYLWHLKVSCKSLWQYRVCYNDMLLALVTAISPAACFVLFISYESLGGHVAYTRCSSLGIGIIAVKSTLHT